MTRADEILARHLPQLPDDQRPLARRLVQIVLEALPDAQWARKGPADLHARRQLAPLDRRDSAGDQGPELVIHKGALLSDPAGLMGTGRYSRTIAPTSTTDIDTTAICAILKEAEQRRTEMLLDENSS